MIRVQDYFALGIKWLPRKLYHCILVISRYRFLAAQIPKEDDFVFQFNEDSLDNKSETGSEKDKASKRLFASTQNVRNTPSPGPLLKNELLFEPESQIGKNSFFDEDEDSIISVVN